MIDLDTNDYTEYASQVGGEEMSVVRHGKEFFESARRDTLTRIYEEDREPFLFGRAGRFYDYLSAYRYRKPHVRQYEGHKDEGRKPHHSGHQHY